MFRLQLRAFIRSFINVETKKIYDSQLQPKHVAVNKLM